MLRFKTLFISLMLALWLSAGCTSTDNPIQQSLSVTVLIDGGSQVVAVNPEATVADALRQGNIVLGDLDLVNPPTYARVENEMMITVKRITEETIVEQETIPFERRTTPSDGLAPGDQQLLQAGVNGSAEITVRIVYEDGVEVSRSEVRQILIKSPEDEIVMVGSQSDLPTVTVSGTLAYISNGNAWMIKQNSSNRRPLTLDGSVDGRVFTLSEDGTMLLFTRHISDEPEEEGQLNEPIDKNEAPDPEVTPADGPAGTEAFNSLWVLFDLGNPNSEPVRLDLDNILDADWVPGQEQTILYSTAEPRPGFPGWQANNDLWQAQVSINGAALQREELLEPSSGGIYGWFGTFYEIAPDGESIAWAQPDSVGVLVPIIDNGDEDENDEQVNAYARQTLISFPPRNPYDFVWVPGLSWSPDGQLITTTTHGEPLGSEAPEDSQVFDLTIVPAQGGYSVTIAPKVGMWSTSVFSPFLNTDEDETTIALAYLQATNPLNSQTSEYRMVISDRDGSNGRQVFPEQGAVGLKASDQDFRWSPQGRQIALTYLGNLYILDVASGVAQQLTSDGLTRSPRWAQ